jgi:hypothetical protein
MDISGKKGDLLERANECARRLGHPKHEAARFNYLSPGERGVAVALQEYVDAKFAELRAELVSFRHTVTTRGDAE